MLARMEALRSRDLHASLGFVETAWALAGERPFTLETIAALQELIPCDFIGYSELDRTHRRLDYYVGNDEDEDDDDDLFWRIVGELPLCHHQQAYADYSATRLSDVVSQRRFVHTRAYAEWFRPFGIVAELEAGIADSRSQTRNFVLHRTHGDFSVRDRAVLDLIRFHLARIHEMTALRRAAGASEPDELDRLTAREAEILELVAAGLTNAAIAERLWISPGTVKKHLDNVYGKLGVANRAAAAVRVGSAS
jgi:DNA-binding CsgD family transcriptional regulator